MSFDWMMAPRLTAKEWRQLAQERTDALRVERRRKDAKTRAKWQREKERFASARRAR